MPPALTRSIGAGLLDALDAPDADEPSRPSRTLRRIRKALDRWVEAEIAEHPWRYSDDPWPALVGTVLEARPGGTGDPTPPRLLEHCPTVDHATKGRMTLLAVMAETPGRQHAVERLATTAQAVRDDVRGWEGDSWRNASPLKPIECSWLDTLALDRTRLTPSTAALRVIARVTGTDVDEKRRSGGPGRTDRE